MKTILFIGAFVMCVMFTACNNKSNNQTQTTEQDTTVVAVDTLQADTVATVAQDSTAVVE